jgi:hypothetical protein
MSVCAPDCGAVLLLTRGRTYRQQWAMQPLLTGNGRHACFCLHTQRANSARLFLTGECARAAGRVVCVCSLELRGIGLCVGVLCSAVHCTCVAAVAALLLVRSGQGRTAALSATPLACRVVHAHTRCAVAAPAVCLPAECTTCCPAARQLTPH